MMITSKLEWRVLGMKGDLNMVLDDDLSDAYSEASANLAEEFGLDVEFAWELLNYA
jgi:hypothetical protein